MIEEVCTIFKNQYQMQLSNIGVIADILWHEIPNHSQNVELGAYVIMPNHIHGILILTGNNGNDTVKTGHALSLQSPLSSSSSPSKTIG